MNQDDIYDDVLTEPESELGEAKFDVISDNFGSVDNEELSLVKKLTSVKDVKNYAMSNLLPIALLTYKDLMINGTSQNIRKQAADKVLELVDADSRSNPHQAGITLNLGADFLKSAQEGMEKIAKDAEEQQTIEE
jgi:hypothetical protein